MKYEIHISKNAEYDLNEIINYIDIVLKNTIAADHFMDLIEEQFSLLSSNPDIYPIVDDSILRTWQFRYIIINNYLVFYIVDHDHKVIYITRVLFNKRNWKAILKQGVSIE